jgi:large conductance mechanosensitive channel
VWQVVVAWKVVIAIINQISRRSLMSGFETSRRTSNNLPQGNTLPATWYFLSRTIQQLTLHSLAAAFTACANSLVSDIILPIISLLPFLSRNLDEKFALLKHGPQYNPNVSNGYNTVKQALDDGAVVFAYGSFLDKVVRFICIALALWAFALAYSRGTDDNIVKKQVKCKFCRKYISEKARRCVNCTSWVDGRET